MRNPLLRSTGVLGGLFYESVIVTESDADRAFYQEINERLLRFQPERGLNNALFLNAQNKQTVPTILAPLRQLGIPAAGIVDVDVRIATLAISCPSISCSPSTPAPASRA